MLGALGIRVLVARGRISLLLVSRKRQKTSASHEFQDQGQDLSCEMVLPLEIGIPGLWDNAVPVNCRTEEYTVHSSTLVRVRGTSFSFGVLYKHFQQHR